VQPKDVFFAVALNQSLDVFSNAMIVTS
jgi:hypothetical protein